MSRPRVTVLATGGTIAGSASLTTDPTGYRAGTTGVEELLAAVPELASLAELRGEQFAQVDSSDMTDAMLIELAHRVEALQSDPGVDAVVITHGTDTLEETAYFLHLVGSGRKPVVLAGAMRPPTALSPDGPRNMFAAVAVAASPQVRGEGVLVVMNDAIHSARDVTKTSALGLGSFSSPHGALGAVAGDRVVLYRRLARPHTAATPFRVPDALPRSVVLFAHSGLEQMDLGALERFDVIVHAGFGNATVSSRLVGALERARERGALLVRASRTGGGPVTVVGASGETVNGWVAVDDQNPQRARLLASLALTVTRDHGEIQRLFHTL